MLNRLNIAGPFLRLTFILESPNPWHYLWLRKVEDGWYQVGAVLVFAFKQDNPDFLTIDCSLNFLSLLQNYNLFIVFLLGKIFISINVAEGLKNRAYTTVEIKGYQS